MSNTLQNIALPRNQWVDIYAATGLSVGRRLTVENLGPASVRMYRGEIVPPDADEDDASGYFNRIMAYKQRSNVESDKGLWCLCESDGLINVFPEQLASITDKTTQKTAFRETLTAELSPLGQIDGVVGITGKVELFEVDGGAVGTENNSFLSISGTQSTGLGSVVTKRQGKVRAGQGLLARGTSAFDTPQLNNNQEFGIISITNRAVFGYFGLEFGIITVVDGQLEIQELTVTTPAAGSENATITTNGIAYTVPLTAGTVEHNAYEIAVSLSAQDPSYIYTSNGATVVARSLRPAATAGVFDFTSATAVATWAQINPTKEVEKTFIPQADWNGFTVPDLNPQLMNYYQVRIGQSAGRVEFSVEDPGGSGLVLVHTIYTNNIVRDIRPSNNIFRAGWINYNDAATVSTTLRGSEASIFVEGKIFIDEPSRAEQNTNPAVGTDPDPVNVLTLRSRNVFKQDQNRNDAIGLLLSVTSESTKSTFIQAIQNADISGDVIYEYVDKENSIIEIYKGGGTVTGGRLVASSVIGPQGSSELGLKQIVGVLLAGDTITLAARLTGGNPSEVSCSSVWQEDL